MSADYDTMTRDELVALLQRRDMEEGQGTRLRYAGQRLPWHIVGKIKPRQQRIDNGVSCRPDEGPINNLIVEGENLQAMVSLYRYRGQVDLILTDPPYNTGRDFRYNDKWDIDPNDPELGDLVPSDDGEKHAKWLRFMAPRLHMMREMLRPGGVLAICIDHRELYRLGILLDSIFGQANRLGIINWQKSYAPKSDRKHVSTATEYVLVYSRSVDRAATSLTARTEKMDARYKTIDGDRERWKSGDITAKGDTSHKGMVYAVQNPFTGALVYPPTGSHWRAEKARLKEWIEGWGSDYIEKDLKDGKAKALVIKGAPLPIISSFSSKDPTLIASAKAAKKVLEGGSWPQAYWTDGGKGGLAYKRYLSGVKQGSVPVTFWSHEDFEDPLDLESVSWVHQQSGHSQTGINELTALLGQGHGFETVKPLKLFKKIISIWCPPDGIVFDPFAGSGTTAHAVLELNVEVEAERSFILVEQGRKENRDPYARTLTAERVRRAIFGQRVNKSGDTITATNGLPGGFRYQRLMKAVNAEAVLALEREEMVDLLLTSHWSDSDRSAHLKRCAPGDHKHLFAVGPRGEGFFLIWEGPGKPSRLDMATYRAIAAEAEQANLARPFHVYARRATYTGHGIEFYQIPNRILERLGFNESVDRFNGGESAEGK